MRFSRNKLPRLLAVATALCAGALAPQAHAQKVSALGAASALSGPELVSGVQGGVTKKITLDQVKTFTSASPTLVTPALGTPASGVATNLTGTAAGLTAGNVTTNANLTGVITSVGNTTSYASSTGSGANVLATSPVLVTPALGTPASGVATNLTGTAAGLTAGNATNAAALGGATFAAPGAIGGTTPGAGAFTTGLFAGNVTFATDNTYDIGAVAANRPRRIYTSDTGTFGNDLKTLGQMEVAAVQKYLFTGRSRIWSNADGSLMVTDSAAATFSCLQMGGSTTSFPALCASGAGLKARLADNSADTTFTASQYTSTVTTGTAPLVVASTTVVANLNASQLGGATFAAPGAIGGGTPGTGAFTSLSSSGASSPNSLAVTTTASVGGILTTSSGVVVKLRVVTASGAVTVATTDDVIVMKKTVPATTVINLPGSPTTGQKFVVKDGQGDFASFNVTITPAAGNVDGTATKILNINWQSVTLVYDGTQWELI